MTKRECAIVSAYTGILCGKFEWFHEYVEELLERPVYTHEFANKKIMELIKEKSKKDFCSMRVEVDE